MILIRNSIRFPFAICRAVCIDRQWYEVISECLPDVCAQYRVLANKCVPCVCLDVPLKICPAASFAKHKNQFARIFHNRKINDSRLNSWVHRVNIIQNKEIESAIKRMNICFLWPVLPINLRRAPATHRTTTKQEKPKSTWMSWQSTDAESNNETQEETHTKSLPNQSEFYMVTNKWTYNRIEWIIILCGSIHLICSDELTSALRAMWSCRACGDENTNYSKVNIISELN